MPSGSSPLTLVVVLTLLGAWSAAVPYVGKATGLEAPVRSTVEVLDHVVPGLLVAAFGGVALRLRAGGGPAGAAGLAAVAALSVCLLSGLWMTSTHLALVVGGIRGLASPGAVVLHALPGPVIAALATSLVVGSVRVVERESLTRGDYGGSSLPVPDPRAA